jgi:phage baseplate assembly protein W
MANVIAGISFPFRIGGAGLPASATGVQVVQSDLIVFLRTPRRSRVMRPTLGTDLQKLIFETTGPVLASLIRREILTGVADEFPMVKIVDIDVKDDNHTVSVNIRYMVQGVRDETGLVTIATRG